MPTERPGVYGNWAPRWKTTRRNGVEWRNNHDPRNVQQLEHYVQYGFIRNEYAAQRPVPPIVVNPPHKNWEMYLDSSLRMYARMREFEFELKGVDGTIDLPLAMHAFAAELTSEMIELYRHNLFPSRFPGRKLRMMSLKAVPSVAMGIVIGIEPEASRLARLLLVAHRRDYFFDRAYRPIFQFALRLLADYLDEAPVAPEGDALKEPILNALFERWREPDTSALSEVCLAACDFHTHRSRATKKDFFEFESFNWNRFPFEILLLFKLRERLGLQNPELDHPLMNTALGRLPPEGRFEPDDLIRRVRARMQQDGYDEQAIYDSICGSVT